MTELKPASEWFDEAETGKDSYDTDPEYIRAIQRNAIEAARDADCVLCGDGGQPVRITPCTGARDYWVHTHDGLQADCLASGARDLLATLGPKTFAADRFIDGQHGNEIPPDVERRLLDAADEPTDP